ncbi:MAG TPA: diguanylate cyclase [Steroidobacteraceae bacterium]|nr:diguanylate cyclase [Steroidobacteraceae bacterium]
MTDGSVELLRAVLDSAPEGVVVCEARGADHALVYANAAFWRLSGYAPGELMGQDLRRLQSWDREQEGRSRLRAAMERGESCRLLLRNYRKDGAQFWNELLVQPLPPAAAGAGAGAGAGADADAAVGASAGPGAGGVTPRVTHFVGFLTDVSERERSAARRGPMPMDRLREDRLSGLYSRAYFEELLRHDWQVGLRERRALTVLAFDINELGAYNDTFGRAAGDACIRRVAGVIGACFRRGSDVVTRWEGACIVAMIRSSDPESLPAFAASIVQKVLEQHIHHPRAQRQKFISISAGAASLEPSGECAPHSLVEAALRALARAKQARPQQIAVAAPNGKD